MKRAEKVVKEEVDALFRYLLFNCKLYYTEAFVNRFWRNIPYTMEGSIARLAQFFLEKTEYCIREEIRTNA